MALGWLNERNFDFFENSRMIHMDGSTHMVDIEVLAGKEEENYRHDGYLFTH